MAVSTLWDKARDDQRILRTGQRSWSRREFLRESEWLAVRLGSSLGESPRIGIHAENSVEWLLFATAIWRISGTVVAIPTNWHPDELARFLEQSAITAVFDLPTMCEWVTHTSSITDATLPEFDEQRAALVVCTSGTMGIPKRVHLSWQALKRHAEMSQQHLGLRDTDNWLLTLPFFHIGGISPLLRALHLEHMLTLPQTNDVTGWSDAFDQIEITHASFVATSLKRLLAHRHEIPLPASVKSILVGGGRVERSLLEQDPRFLATYGMTECASQIATMSPHAQNNEQDCLPLPGVKLRIIDETGEALPANHEGLIQVYTPALADGYEGMAPFDSEWFATGDYGILNDRGALVVTGRRADRIVTGGENVSPSEVEALLREVPGVDDAIVFGLPHPDWGEQVVAVVAGSGVTVESLESTLSGHIARFKVPRQWRIVAELPLTATGKHNRQALPEMFI